MNKYHPSGRLYTEDELRARALASCPRSFYIGYPSGAVERMQFIMERGNIKPHVHAPDYLSKGKRRKLKAAARRQSR